MLSQPEIISVVEIGLPVSKLRVVFDYDIVNGYDLEGFLIEWSENSSWVPTWIIPPAVDLENPQSDNGSPIERRIVLIHLLSNLVTWWETFEEYPDGFNARLDKGGSSWDGNWVTYLPYIGYKNDHEDFESYPEGPNSIMDESKGWDGAFGTTMTHVGFKNYMDDFESYSVGSHAVLNGGLGWNGHWGV